MQVPLVGAHFHPPAKALLQCLPAGAPLVLEREPDNPYDPNAIKVLCPSTAIPASQHQALETLVAGYGLELAQVLGHAQWWLGFIKATEAQGLAPRLDSGAKFKATLAFAGDGKPLINIQQE